MEITFLNYRTKETHTISAPHESWIEHASAMVDHLRERDGDETWTIHQLRDEAPQTPTMRDPDELLHRAQSAELRAAEFEQIAHQARIVVRRWRDGKSTSDEIALLDVALAKYAPQIDITEGCEVREVEI